MVTLLVVIFIIGCIVAVTRPQSEAWPHPEEGEENPYKNWSE
jgi:hypothetical protein